MCSIAAFVKCHQKAGVEVCNVQLFIGEIGLAKEEERAGERADKFVGEFEDAIKDIEVDQFGVDANTTQFSSDTRAAVVLGREDPLEVIRVEVEFVRVLMVADLSLWTLTDPRVSNKQVAL